MSTFSFPKVSAEDGPVVRTVLNDAVVVLTLNRPFRCNSFTPDMLDTLLGELKKIQSDPPFLLVLRGNGSTFCTGLDLNETAKYLESHTCLELATRVVDVVRRLASLQSIVVTVAQRIAYGGGAALLAVSDLTIVDENFQLALPELRNGFPPGVLHPYLKRRMSPALLTDLVLTGEPIDAETARLGGLVHRIVPTQQLETATSVVLADILRGNPHLLRQAKELARSEKLPLESEISPLRESDFFAFKEGVAAFVEKRLPNWMKEK